MAYNNAIPQATNLLSQSQLDLLANFQAIKTLVDINHVTFNIADQGKHKWVTFPLQGVVPTPPFGASEISLYNFTDPVTGTKQLFVQKDTSAGIPMTACDPVLQGWSYLPSGLIIKWGIQATNGALPQPLSFPITQGPAFTTVLNASVTTTVVAQSDSFVQLSSVTTTNILVFSTKRTTTAAVSSGFSYIVIGI